MRKGCTGIMLIQPEAWTRHLDQAAGQRAWVLAPEITGYQLEKYKAVRLMREQTTILCRQGRSPVVRMILTAPQQGREALCRLGCFLWRKKDHFFDDKIEPSQIPEADLLRRTVDENENRM